MLALYVGKNSSFFSIIFFNLHFEFLVPIETFHPMKTVVNAVKSSCLKIIFGQSMF